MTIADQLVDIYYDKEDWHDERISRESAKKDFENKISSKNIICNDLKLYFLL